MFKLFKNAFRLTNEGILLAIPLILFIWLLSLYVNFAKYFVDTLPEAISAFITLLCMVGAFCAGWFYMVKNSIDISKKEYVLDEDRAKELKNLVKTIPTGIGNYFLSFLGMIILSLFVFAIFGGFFYKVGMHYIGGIDFSPAQIRAAAASAQDMKMFIDTLSPEQIYKLGCWNLLLMASSSILSFLLMLWVPEIIYKTLNPLRALYNSLVKLFVKFPKSLILFLYLTVLNIIITFANTFAVLHPLIYMVLMTIYLYFLVYMTVLIFSYYDKEFNGNEE